MDYALRKPISEYTLRSMIEELKAAGAFKSSPTNHLTEATNKDLKPGTESKFPIKLEDGQKLGNLEMEYIMRTLTIRHLGMVKHLQKVVISTLIDFAKYNELPWEVGEIVEL